MQQISFNMELTLNLPSLYMGFTSILRCYKLRVQMRRRVANLRRNAPLSVGD